eukprot:364100-Chlamydomonas_euryale.AAC.13
MDESMPADGGASRDPQRPRDPVRLRVKDRAHDDEDISRTFRPCVLGAAASWLPAPGASRIAAASLDGVFAGCLLRSSVDAALCNHGALATCDLSCMSCGRSNIRKELSKASALPSDTSHVARPRQIRHDRPTKSSDFDTHNGALILVYTPPHRYFDSLHPCAELRDLEMLFKYFGQVESFKLVKVRCDGGSARSCQATEFGLRMLSMPDL